MPLRHEQDSRLSYTLADARLLGWVADGGYLLGELA